MVVQAGGLVVCIPCATDWLAWIQFPGLCFLAFFGTSLAEKTGFGCTNKSCQKKVSAHMPPICISLCVGWVCKFVVQPNFRLSFISLHGPLALLWLCKLLVRWYATCAVDWVAWV